MILTKTFAIAANVTVVRVKGRDDYKGKSGPMLLVDEGDSVYVLLLAKESS